LKIKGIYFLYRLLQILALPWVVFYFLWRGLKNRGYWRTLAQRCGYLPRSYRQTGPGAIWLHAVSVGEVLSCQEFLRQMKQRRPRSPIFVSTATLAGRATADEKLRDLADGVFYAPIDYVSAVRRVLRTLQPSVLVVAETEMWPNLFREVKQTGAGLALVNGRISDQALPRYRHQAWLFRAVLPAVDRLLAQTDIMKSRFLEIGAPAGRSEVGGNFKHDFEARSADPASPVRVLLDGIPTPPRVWIAASTMPPAAPGDPDEDDAVIDAYQQLAAGRSDLVLLLAPRKPERFDLTARKLETRQIRYIRRSQMDGGGKIATPFVLLLDTIGELSGLFDAAEVVFMGGSLARRGGHNILEPAFFAKPVVMGPHMENFQAIADEFRAAGACVEISSAAELAGAVGGLLDDAETAREIGARALARAQANRGGSARAAEAVLELHRTHLPRYRPAWPWLVLRSALSRLWIWGGRRRREADLRAQRKLDLPVVSVGNLSMGGTGKTPTVLRLAESLKLRGHTPGILTRGYKRGTPEKHLALAPGADCTTVQSGDEPQIFVRSRLAPVGIGINRWETGMLLRRHFEIDVMLLDDGFQHLKLARDVDVVLLDALNPLDGVFPLGHLREPPESLGRADIVLITRDRFSDLGDAIEHELRRWNDRAPVFRASVEPVAWIAQATGQAQPIDERPFQNAAVFCGLGNPESFRRTLKALSVDPVDWVEFDDHHHYRPAELRRLAHHAERRQADAVVTTEKDAVNLCESASDQLKPLPLYWLKVSMIIDREAEFLDEIERRVRLGQPHP
jgi:3-deoxy-D-manno-octulosonic-acid transferase